MNAVLGIIATIVAAVKGHKTFAWVTGIWTGLAILLSLSGYSNIAIGPGVIFLAIAFGMKKVKPEESDTAASDSSVLEQGFVCSSCGHKEKNWFMTCPKCGAVGKVTEIASNDNSEKDDSKNPSSMPNNPVPYASAVDSPNSNITLTPTEQTGAKDIQFCRKCGHELLPGMSFCSECGTKIEQQANGAVMAIKYCRFCGSPLLSDSSRCPQCHAEVNPDISVPELPHTRGKESAPIDPSPAPTLDYSQMSPALRRAFILAEDEEWEKADEYFERVLDEEPENVYAYVGKALVEIKAGTLDRLTNEEMIAICKTKYYKRACKYAQEKEKELFTYWQNCADQSGTAAPQ